MPISDGQVTGRDIRQQSIKTLHMVDENVTTPKMADLAVTVDKNNTVLDWEWNNPAFTQDVTINTTWASHNSTDIDVPAWAQTMALSTYADLQAIIASDTTFFYWTTIDSPVEPSGVNTQELAATGTRHLTHTRYWQATVTPGSTISVDFWIRTSTGSNSLNIVRLDTLAYFRR